MKIDAILLKRLIFCYWISYFLQFLGPSLWMHNGLADSLGLKLIEASTSPMYFALVVGLSLFFFSNYLLYKQKPLGRPLFALFIFFSALLHLMTGYAVLDPVRAFAFTISDLFAGAILFLIYTPEGKNLFIKPELKNNC